MKSKQSVFAFTSIISIIAAGAAFAGGPAVVAVESEPSATTASTVALSGGIGLKFGQMAFEQTDDSLDESGLDVFALNGYLRMDWNAWSVFADVNSTRRDIGDEDFDEYAPEGATSYGLHAGRNFGAVYAGAFIGRNRFQGDDADTTNGYVSGKLYGLETEYRFSDAGAVFAQIGDAEMIGDGTDTAFDGRFYRVGASYQFASFGIAVDYEAGKSKDVFEDSGDEGDYKAYSIEGSYAIRPNLMATVGYERMDITANTEDDGSEDTFTLGLAIAFGDKTDRHNLTTTYKPGLAAAWAEALD